MAPKNPNLKMKMVEMLPKNGMVYEFINDINKPGARCILPGWEAAEIMMALNKKYQNPTKKDFDQEIALLIQKGLEYARYRIMAVEGKIPHSALFWREPKDQTMFKDIHQATVYRFVLKILEAREIWIGNHDQEQLLRSIHYQCETAKAVDRFSSFIAAAGVIHSDKADNLAAHMIGDMAEQIEEKDTAGEVHYMEEEEEDYNPVKEMNHQSATSAEIGNVDKNAAESGQDVEMESAETEAYGAILAQLAMEDLENAVEEDMMELELE
ncbi:hypothetical protein VMCG_04921 [Cytospora schulzeri]|uniref:Uncharacterized protein n=1 Tax=Cytospora schulzeri TaxID=448051 RepID=A0A423WNH3_9PEZI|nr:hypothetical protein VMCG_04921 [Valsa malicola]